MSDRHTEPTGLTIHEVPETAALLLEAELQPLLNRGVADRDLDEVISIALHELVTHGERTLSQMVLQGIA